MLTSRRLWGARGLSWSTPTRIVRGSSGASGAGIARSYHKPTNPDVLHTVVIPPHYPVQEHLNPILYLHGALGSSRNWRGTATKIHKETGCPGILVDARNHGESFHHPDMTLSAMCQDILGIMKHHNLTKVSFIGHSMGGKTAMEFACRYPHMVEQLVVVDIAPVVYDPDTNQILKSIAILKKLHLDSFKKREHIDEALSQYIQDPLYRGFLLQNLGVLHHHKYEWRIPLDFIEEGIPQFVRRAVGEDEPGAQFTGKTLFIGGTQSNYILPEYHQRIFQLFPNALIKMVPSGHLPHVQTPDHFLQEVTNFMVEQ
eukprot:TRINITY_DN1378_c0_g1_i1.p1 TRINITY_DN1378_c0_g1~~TRINITY_DN1378_c0_g1_i1.p1  ORF type:complete len:322 (-),score=39.84 TRINITY_DN1378_c0_g1_i1:835-1776(-)